MKKLSTIAICCLILGSCSSGVVSSSAIPTNSEMALQGIPYYLPATELTLAVRAGYTESEDGVRTYVALDGGLTDQISAVPDNTHPLFATYIPSGLADDHVCFGVSSNGLLETVQVVATDRTDDILVRLAQTATLLTTGSGTPGSSFAGDPESAILSTGQIIWEQDAFIEVSFLAHQENDGFTDYAIREGLTEHIRFRKTELGNDKVTISDDLQRLLSSDGSFFHIGLASYAPDSGLNENLPGLERTVTTNDGNDETTVTNGPAPGVFVRNPALQRLVIQPASLIPGKVRTATFIGPDPNTTAFVKLERSAFVAKEYNLKLTDGSLTQFEVKKPSQVLEAASLPLEVAGAVIETPARFFTAIARSARSEAGAIQAKAELLKAQAEFEKAQEDPITNTVSKPGDAGSETGLSGTLPQKQALSSSLTCFQKGGS